MSQNIRLSNGETIALRDYIERILSEREVARIESQRVLQVHLENLNHWKEETLRERERLVSKEYYASQHDSLLLRLDRIEKMQSRMIGIGIAMVAGAGLIGAVITHILKP